MLNAYGCRYGMIKERRQGLRRRRAAEGITAVISVKLKEAQFEGQTKAKLGNADIRTLVPTWSTTKLMEYLRGEPRRGQGHLGKGH